MGHEVAIVGAGPSGAWTATRLASHGVRVVLIDPSHPREKPCGGGVTGRALRIVEPLLPEVFRGVRIRAARFLDSAARTSALVPLEPDASALTIVSRAQFDGHLYEAARKAGADVHASRVTDVVRNRRGVRVDCADGASFVARFLVGADGANSLVRRRVTAAFRRDQLSIATGFFAYGATSDEIVIELTANPPGYIWSFPRPDHLAIGICTGADAGVTAGALRAIVRRWIEATGVGTDVRLEPYSWPIPSLVAADFQTLEISGPNWLTVGDAAGLVDPLTREGIFFALQSAEFAAEALSSSDGPHLFAERVRDEIGAELARAARLKTAFFRPQFTRLLMEALSSSEGVRRVMADLVAGTQTYRGLKWRLLQTLEFGFAWRLLSGMVRSL